MYKLYNGDSSILYKSHINTIDCIVTDPPYPLTSGGSKTGQMGGCFSPEKYNNNGSIVECEISWDTIMTICYELLKPNTHAYIMTNDRNKVKAILASEKVGFKFHNELVWNKGTVTPNRWYMHQLEYCLFLYKGKSKSIKNKGMSNYFEYINKKNTKHPNEKPVKLMEDWIENSSNYNDIVCDPFMGSGSTGVACMNLNRQFIGFEKNEDYFNIADLRIKQSIIQSEINNLIFKPLNV